MKGSNTGFVAYILTFLSCWALVTGLGWKFFNGVSTDMILPHIEDLMAKSHDAFVHLLGTSMAVAGGFIGALILMVLGLLVSTFYYRLRGK
jgi:hypothetical protein